MGKKKFSLRKVVIGIIVFAIAIALVLITWAIAGKDIWAVLGSPLFVMWYGIALVAILTVWFVISSKKDKRG